VQRTAPNSKRVDPLPGVVGKGLPLGVRVLIAVGLVWLALLGGLRWVFRSFVQPTFVALETRYASDDMARVHGAFSQDLEALSLTVRDYATWDEMYAFTSKPTADFIATNLADSVFVTLKIDLLFVYDVDRNSVYAKALDPVSATRHQFRETDPSEFKKRFDYVIQTDRNRPLETLKRSGTFRLSDGRLIELASWPIAKSNGSGPVGGTVIMGRIVADRLITELRERTRVPFELESRQPIGESRTDDNPIIDGGKVALSARWYDPQKQPIARIRFIRPAAIVEQGRHTVVLSTVSTLVVSSMVLVLLLFLLQYAVINPVGRLASAIESIQLSGDLNTRLSLDRNDEIGALARSFDRLLALLSERAQNLQHLATVDELTGIPNRRAIMDFLHQEIERAIRYEEGLAILLIDVDYFKRINDTEGHAVGDRVLRNIARVLKGALRTTDLVGRYGGEEFLVVMPHQTMTGTLTVAERLRSAVETDDTTQLCWNVTVSIGAAWWDGHTREGLLHIADKNLYAAKNRGRNCVVLREVPRSELPKSSMASLRARSHKPSKP
jgi:diguanylate cyclase (GGDEF)-like protein